MQREGRKLGDLVLSTAPGPLRWSGKGPVLGPWKASRFRRRVHANLGHGFSRPVLRAQGALPQGGRDIPQVDISRTRPGRQRTQVARRGDTAAETGIHGPGSNPACAKDSPSPSRRPPSPGERLPQTGAQGRTRSYKEDSAAVRPTRAALPTSAHSRSPTGLGQGRTGPEPEAAAPRAGHARAARARARARPETRPRPRVERTLPPRRPPPPPTACPSVLRVGGRPPLPGTHRYQRGRLPAAPRPQARRSRLGLSPPARRRTKAPPTDQRGHEAMAAGAECGGGGRGRARSGGRGSDVKSVRVYGRAEWRRPSPGRRGRASGVGTAVGNASGCLVTGSLWRTSFFPVSRALPHLGNWANMTFKSLSTFSPVHPSKHLLDLHIGEYAVSKPDRKRAERRRKKAVFKFTFK